MVDGLSLVGTSVYFREPGFSEGFKENFKTTKLESPDP